LYPLDQIANKRFLDKTLEVKMERIYTVKVVPNAKLTKLVVTDQLLKVWVNAPAIDDKANKAVIEILAKHFQIQKKSVEILIGHQNKNKLVRVHAD
jgi:uncharacterized protein (TIGR00251 family)